MSSNSIYTYRFSCSCILCKRIFTKLSSLQTHKCYRTEPNDYDRAIGVATLRKNQFPIKIEQWKNYYKIPKLCKNCICSIDWFHKSNTFCSSSCSATYSNPRKSKRSPESRNKTSSALSKTTNRIKYSPVKFNFCRYCGISYTYSTRLKSSEKYCSKLCLKLGISKMRSDWLKIPNNRKNYGRGKPSYMEKTFKEWLISHNIEFDDEILIHNTEINKNYFVDFIFESIKLIIELDGTQHRNTIDSDNIRDEYLSRIYGYTVLRITSKEYKNKTKYKLVCSLLGIEI